VYRFIREHGGWDAWSMILIKKYPHVVDNQELLMKERKWITKLNATLNKRVPCALLELGKTEYGKQYFKEYSKLNKNKLLEYSKHHYEKNKDKKLEYNKQRYEKNKEHLTEKIKCECGCTIKRCSMTYHIKTKKHIKLMTDK
jgi:hypothetical protein